MVSISAAYAQGLLMTKDPADRAKAETILRAVLAKQDLRKDSPTYGSFLEYQEDDWATVVNPDPNYGQFVGLGRCRAFSIKTTSRGACFRPTCASRSKKRFGHAVEFTIRRDVDPGYINISIMFGSNGSGRGQAAEFSRRNRFCDEQVWIGSARAQPGTTFTEYLAPTYYGTDLGAAYTARDYATTLPNLTSAANRLIGAFWKDIAASTTRPPCSLPAPNARSYGENMLQYAAGLKYFLMFALNGKYPLADTEVEPSWIARG